MSRPNSLEKHQTLIKQLSSLPPWLRKTITSDNGSEHAKHQVIANSLKVKYYFCHTYTSWERGTVENTIGLIREFLPKKLSFANIEQRELNLIAASLNNRPRKCLNYRTPLEVFKKELSGAFRY
jgi:IS30 family transposase